MVDEIEAKARKAPAKVKPVKTEREEKAKDPYTHHTHGGVIRTPSSSNTLLHSNKSVER
jgi:hypothetical protein